MALRLVWKLLLSVVTFEFQDAWLLLLLLWIHIRYPHQVHGVEDPDEGESGSQS